MKDDDGKCCQITSHQYKGSKYDESHLSFFSGGGGKNNLT